ncbi:serine/threonine-protein kinase [Herbidospora cretacea]|uniref:serine/threonine-protein kinase n=1 Tax=Herbidospora cretacea TaxID=28444 RepID=UPI00068D5B71|nr:serine/threonine-protein kinase [Herbidospora cretacea]
MPESQTSDRIVASRYRLIEPLGRGGMGTVWRALDETLEREVAVKELNADLSGADREIFTIRTLREARAAGRVSHPAVAAVYDVFEEGGHPWIVMQYVPSTTLGALIRDEGPMRPHRVATIGLQVLSALKAAHAAGVLHRDVKPDNVLITPDGRAVLTDFGIAAMEDDSPVTRTGSLVGTPAFISPERAAGGRAVRASDLWSLGVTLFLAVEGRSPFHRGHAMASLAAVMYEPYGQLYRAGPLTPVLHGLLEKDPARRMTAAEAESHLHTIVNGITSEPTAPFIPVPPPPPVKESPRRRWPFTAVVSAVLAVGLSAGTVAYMTAGDPPVNPADTIPAQVPAKKKAKATPEATPEPTAEKTSGEEPAARPTERSQGEQERAQAPSPKASPSGRSSKEASPPNEESESEEEPSPTQEPTEEPAEEPSTEENTGEESQQSQESQENQSLESTGQLEGRLPDE